MDSNAHAVDTEPHPIPAIGGALVNFGAMQAQDREHVAHVRYWQDLEFSMLEATTAVAAASLVQRIEFPAAVNYVCLSPSLRSADVFLSVDNDLWFDKLNGVYYPRADYVCRGAGSTSLYRIPNRKGHVFNICVWGQALAAGYVDGVRFICGYLPDEADNSALV